jgi:hypothetical protein
MRAFYQHQLSCARASNPHPRWFIHPHRKRWGIKNLFRKSTTKIILDIPAFLSVSRRRPIDGITSGHMFV